MNPVLKNILDDGHVYHEDGQRKYRPHAETSINRAKVDFLHKLVAELKPKHSLEVGLAYGVSALCICDALSENDAARHIIIDPLQSTKFENVGLANLESAGFRDLVDFHEAPSYAALPELAASGLKIDFAFVDGAHWHDYVLLDFFYIDLMLRPGGIIVFDDTQEKFAGIRKVLRYIVTNRDYGVFRCLGGHRRPQSWKRNLLRWAARSSPAIRSVLRPEFLETDCELGILPASPLIALKKQADDQRIWNYFREF